MQTVQQRTTHALPSTLSASNLRFFVALILVQSGSRLPEALLLNCNCSHHDGLIVCASSNEALVGVDVMSFEMRPAVASDEAFFAIMADYFSGDEWRAIREAQVPHHSVVTTEFARGAAPRVVGISGRLQSFYWHWCAKEALIKTLGLGLHVPLLRLRVRIGACDLKEVLAPSDGPAEPESEAATALTVLVDGERPSGWTFHAMLIDGFFPCVVCTAPPEHAAEALGSPWPRPAATATTSRGTANPERLVSSVGSLGGVVEALRGRAGADALPHGLVDSALGSLHGSVGAKCEVFKLRVCEISVAELRAAAV